MTTEHRENRSLRTTGTYYTTTSWHDAGDMKRTRSLVMSAGAFVVVCESAIRRSVG